MHDSSCLTWAGMALVCIVPPAWAALSDAVPLQAWFRRALAHEGLHRLDAAQCDARQAVATARSAPVAESLLQAPPQDGFTGSRLYLVASLLCLCIPQSVNLVSCFEDDTGFVLQLLDVLQSLHVLPAARKGLKLRRSGCCSA